MKLAHLAVCAGLLWMSSAIAHADPIDLNDFFADGDVVVSADGTTALLSEDVAGFGFLEIDPFLGDPDLITPLLAADEFEISFDILISSPAGNDDEFRFVVFDTDIGGSADPGAFIHESIFNSTDDGLSATITLDLSVFLAGGTVGLSFQLNPFDAAFTSTFRISNLQTIDPPPPTGPGPGGPGPGGLPIPEPATLVLVGVGVAIAAYRRRRFIG